MHAIYLPKCALPWDTQLIGALTMPAFVGYGCVTEDHRWMWTPTFDTGARHNWEREIAMLWTLSNFIVEFPRPLRS
jgi:hypothetical protein